jgi:hypothetical protein
MSPFVWLGIAMAVYAVVMFFVILFMKGAGDAAQELDRIEEGPEQLREAFTLKRLPYTERHNDQRERKWEWDERKYLDRIWPSDPA